MKKLLLCIVLSLLCSFARADMPTIELGVGMFRIKAEVANTQATRMTGLMRRTEMAADAGMLFIFAAQQKHCMWMRNTLIPLSVAFIDEQGIIINIADMQPQSDTVHCAGRPARYALETNTGWFASRRLTPGARVSGLERAPAPD